MNVSATLDIFADLVSVPWKICHWAVRLAPTCFLGPRFWSIMEFLNPQNWLAQRCQQKTMPRRNEQPHFVLQQVFRNMDRSQFCRNRLYVTCLKWFLCLFCLVKFLWASQKTTSLQVAEAAWLQERPQALLLVVGSFEFEVLRSATRLLFWCS